MPKRCLISENETTIQSTNCKDKISTKKCEKLKKKGKCKNKKIWKKCMDTCEKCTPGIIDDFQLHYTKGKKVMLTKLELI